MGSASILVPYDDRWYFAEVLRGAREGLEAAGHTAIVHVIPPDGAATGGAADAIDRDFQDDGCVGAIAAGFKYNPSQSMRAAAWTRPIVVVGGSVLGFPTVMIDDIGAAAMATDHLLHLGHTRIVHFAGELDHQMAFSVHGRRARGYRLAMDRAGLEPDVVESEFDAAAVHRAALAVLQRETPPTAAFVVSDEMAYAVLDAAAESGLRPGVDFSVTSVDDHPDAEGRGLTTVRQRPAEMGMTAVDLLLSGIGHGPDPKQSRLAPIALVERRSAGRASRPALR